MSLSLPARLDRLGNEERHNGGSNEEVERERAGAAGRVEIFPALKDSLRVASSLRQALHSGFRVDPRLLAPGEGVLASSLKRSSHRVPGLLAGH